MEELSESRCESDLVRLFRELAGVGEDLSEFAIVERGCRVHVKYYGGSGSYLSLSAPYPSTPTGATPDPSAQGGGYRQPAARVVSAPRPMAITLRAETDADRDAKLEAIAREFQSGDAAFDEAVYVDTASGDETLRHVLASQSLRDGVRALIAEGVRSVVLDADVPARIVAEMYTFAGGKADEQRARRMLTAFIDVALGAPYVAPSGEPLPRDPTATALAGMSVVAVVCAVGILPTTFALAPAGCVVSDGDGSSLKCSVARCCDGSIVGLTAGLPIGLVLAIVLASRIRGRSNSASQRTWARFVITALFVELSVLVCSLVGWRR